MLPPASRWLPAAGLAIACVLVVTLTAQKRALQSELEASQLERERPYPGLSVPEFASRTLSGENVIIAGGMPGDRQILFVFDTACGYCKRTVPVWNRIAGTLRNIRGVAVYGISLNDEASTRRYVEKMKLTFPVLLFPDPRTARLFRAEVVPITAMVNSDGVLEHVRLGALDRAPSAVDSIIDAIRGVSRGGKFEGAK